MPYSRFPSVRGIALVRSEQLFTRVAERAPGLTINSLAYAEMRLILARILFNFDMELVNPNANWIDNQKVYTLWSKSELNVYLTPVQ